MVRSKQSVVTVKFPIYCVVEFPLPQCHASPIQRPSEVKKNDNKKKLLNYKQAK